MKKRYMHTINGKPGAFDGDQICYLWQRAKSPCRDTLAEIRADQRASIRYRVKRGFNINVKYGHILFYEDGEK